MRKEVRLLLFRKLSKQPSIAQTKMAQTAAIEIKDQVFSAGPGPVVINYNSTVDALKDPDNMVNCILDVLFRSVYSLEAKKEVHVTVTHSRLSRDPDVLNSHLNKWPGPPSPNEHFVAAPADVQSYVAMAMGKGDQNNPMIFTIHVRQTKKSGTLHLLYFRKLVRDFSSPSSAVDILVNILQVLEHSSKTHLEYQNIQLTKILKDIMGDNDRTVLVNFPIGVKKVASQEEGAAEQWKSMFMLEHQKYRCLKNKVLSLVTHDEDLNKFMENLERINSPKELESLGDRAIEQKNPKCIEKILRNNEELKWELEQIGTAAELSVHNLHSLLQDIDHMTDHQYILQQQLNLKDLKLSTLKGQLHKARQELREQKTQFQKKVSEYSEMSHRLWRQQLADMQLQEVQQRRQLSDAFDAICQELEAVQLKANQVKSANS